LSKDALVGIHVFNPPLSILLNPLYIPSLSATQVGIHNRLDMLDSNIGDLYNILILTLPPSPPLLLLQILILLLTLILTLTPLLLLYYYYYYYHYTGRLHKDIEGYSFKWGRRGKKVTKKYNILILLLLLLLQSA
jgi:hypothetical protein